MENNNYLFVYGSLRSGFKSDAYNYISNHFTLVAQAKTQGLLYNMGNYPVAVATNTNHFIVGELYKIKNNNAFNFVIAQLDDYEGLNAEAHETTLYKREICSIAIDSTTTINAWIYWFCGDITNQPIIEHGDVLQYFLDKK
jgi:gamma-glutamylcyclotransferase (GGCT)/AIG2-like uncharacterized protein YtfP